MNEKVVFSLKLEAEDIVILGDKSKCILLYIMGFLKTVKTRPIFKGILYTYLHYSVPFNPLYLLALKLLVSLTPKNLYIFKMI